MEEGEGGGGTGGILTVLYNILYNTNYLLPLLYLYIVVPSQSYAPVSMISDGLSAAFLRPTVRDCFFLVESSVFTTYSSGWLLMG